MLNFMYFQGSVKMVSEVDPSSTPDNVFLTNIIEGKRGRGRSRSVSALDRKEWSVVQIFCNGLLQSIYLLFLLCIKYIFVLFQ